MAAEAQRLVGSLCKGCYKESHNLREVLVLVPFSAMSLDVMKPKQHDYESEKYSQTLVECKLSMVI